MTPVDRAAGREQALAEVRLALELRRSDIDSLGHLGQATYHLFLAEGRTALLDRLGLRNQGEFVMAHVELDHRSEVLLRHERVFVEAHVARVGRSSVDIAHAIALEDGTVAASGRSVLVAWDARARRARQLSAAELATLTTGHRDAPSAPI